jgi:hypothetical protein
MAMTGRNTPSIIASSIGMIERSVFMNFINAKPNRSAAGFQKINE